MSYKIRHLVIENNKQAQEEFSKIKATPQGINIMSSKLFNLVLKIKDVDNRAVNILKQEMLSRDGEVVTCRESLSSCEGKSDIIIFGTKKKVYSLIEKIKLQPFGLKVLAQDLENFLSNYYSSGQRKFLNISRKSFDLENEVIIMGILNVTPDSFYDGGKYLKSEDAYKRIDQLVNEGAHIIDIGGMSTRPGSEEINIEEEINRTIFLVKYIKKNYDNLVSIDTYRSEVAERALDAGCDIVNDISGFTFDDNMKRVVSNYKASCVLMHIKGTPRDMQKNPEYGDVIEEIYDYLFAQVNVALNAGIDKEKIIVDPGIGFGKTMQHNFIVLKKIEELKSLGCPILVGASRKSFIGNFLNLSPDDRLEGSLAVAAYCVHKGVSILRVHDVKGTIRAVRLIKAIENQQT